MIFNSFEFLLFLAVVYILYWFIGYKKSNWQNLLLLVASYFFYAWWSWKFLLLLLLSTLMDYLFAFSIASGNKKKSIFYLWVSVISNLGILAIFKYYNFFATEFHRIFALLGFNIGFPLLNIILPIGISFYTFHGLSYLFDVYRGLRKPVTSFIDYGVFVSFFPLLIAGPIERANHLLPQVQNKREFNYNQSVEGCRLILWGLFKKVVIADSLANVVDNIFNHYHHYSASTLIIGTIGFSFQIYADFSGYTDIAIGVSKLFGFEVLSNFKFPYFSRDIAEFWRRWHISLTSWFKDYLYIPLGGSREGRILTIRNTCIVFLVCGLWHGAHWSFIVWGIIHAIGFMFLLLRKKNRIHTNNIVAFDKELPDFQESLKIILTFSFVTFSWIFFRLTNLSDSIGFVKQILKSSIQNPRQYCTFNHYGISVIYYAIPFVLIDWWLRRDERKLRVIPNVVLRNAVYFCMIITILFLLIIRNKGSNNFIYFQF